MTQLPLLDAVTMLTLGCLLAIYTIYVKDWVGTTFLVTVSTMQISRIVEVPVWWSWIDLLAKWLMVLTLALFVIRYLYRKSINSKTKK